jgi:hypothetical protein
VLWQRSCVRRLDSATGMVKLTHTYTSDPDTHTCLINGRAQPLANYLFDVVALAIFEYGELPDAL